MSGTERSAALRRMGIVEWLPRADDAIVPAVAEPVAPTRSAAPAASPAAMAPAPVAMAVVSAEVLSPRQASATAPADVAVIPSPALTQSADAQRVVAVMPVAAASASPVSASPASPVPGLRGRLLAARSGAALLVLALAEKSARDAMLQPDTAAGVLLNAMLAQLPAPAAVALLGVERGEPLAVPATILVLGERSARLLLGNDVAMPLRGRVHLFGQSRVVVSYHPDELRQNGSLKRLAWDDLRLLAGLLKPATGIDLESR